MMRVVSLTFLTWFALAGAASAEPEAQLYVLAIGYNGLPASAADMGLRELRYADDDAAAFAQFAREMGGHVILLSAPDTDTARRFPELAVQPRPPLRSELRRAVRELNASFEQDRRRGVGAVLLLTYSGHGAIGDDGQPALTLADGALTRAMLYAEVLAALEARYVHIVVDACHAEAVVRPRDLQADTVTLRADEVQSSLSRVTLQGLPHVGALIASSASAQSHEWDTWQHGLFTHEVLSGLRGAADVNGDLRIEYSEMAAFLSAANREVSDRAARIKPLVKAPAAAPRAPIVTLRSERLSAFLVGRAGLLGGLWIEAENGERIADLRFEQEHYLQLLVPSDRRLFVRSTSREAALTIPAGGRAVLDHLTTSARGLRARGSLDLSLQRGLFAAAFGPSYYRGFVDRADDPVSIPLRLQHGSAATDAAPRTVEARSSRTLAWTAMGVSAALLVASAAFGGLALDAKADFHAANGLERDSFEAASRYKTHRALSITTLITGALTGGLSYVLFARH